MEQELQKLLQKIISELYNVHLEEIQLDTPPKKELWDYAFGCFPLAKELKKWPQVIAEELKLALLENQKNTVAQQGQILVSDASIAWPYLNITLNHSKLWVLHLLHRYNKTKIQDNQKDKTVIIDYIWANVWKPLHIGHVCTPSQWEAMVNAYKEAGFTVISDSHIWDWGIIFGKLILAYKKWGEKEKLSWDAVEYLLELYVKITNESAVDDSIEEQTREEFKKLSEWNPESVALWKLFTSESIDAMNKVLARLHVKPDFNIGESFYEWIGLPKIENYPDLSENMHEVVNELIALGIATKNEDNSVGVEFSEASGIPSCILQKRNGTHGYLASDLACIKYRMKNWSPESIIYFVDVRQKLHLEQVFYISKKAWWTKRNWAAETELFHAYNGFISGKDWAFSTRKGNIIRLSEVLDQAEQRARKLILEKRDDLQEGDEKLKSLGRIIWIWAIKYGYLKKKRTTDVIFDWDEFMSFEGNSGPYIQYAYVRATKILSKAVWDYSKINYDDMSEYSKKKSLKISRQLIYKLWKFYSSDGVLQECLEKESPHIIAQYTYELTKDFSDFYSNVSVLDELDLNMKNVHLTIVKEYSLMIEKCFNILGIELPDEM